MLMISLTDAPPRRDTLRAAEILLATSPVNAFRKIGTPDDLGSIATVTHFALNGDSSRLYAALSVGSGETPGVWVTDIGF